MNLILVLLLGLAYLVLSFSLQVDRTENLVRQITSAAEIYRTSFSRVEVGWVLDLASYSGSTYRGQVEEDAFRAFCSPCGSSAVSPPPHVASTLTSCSVVFRGDLRLSKVNSALDSLLYSFSPMTVTHSATLPVSPKDNSDNLLVPPQDTLRETNSKKVKQNMHAPTIYRVKGVVHLEGQSLIHILQGVHDVFDIQPSDVFRGSDADKLRGENRFIFIGDNLSQEYLGNILVNCIAD